MSESFSAAVEKVNYGKYIDQIQDELKSIASSMGAARTQPEIDTIQIKLCDLIRKQSKELAKEIGLSGSNVLVFMTSASIITTAWVSFALRRETSDLAKSPEDRLALVEMLDSLDLALQKVVGSATNYADMKK